MIRIINFLRDRWYCIRNVFFVPSGGFPVSVVRAYFPVILRHSPLSFPCRYFSDIRLFTVTERIPLLFGYAGLLMRRFPASGKLLISVGKISWHFIFKYTYTELIVSTETISITEEAYERLRALKKDEKTSFSDVIVRYYPVKRKLFDVLAELGDCTVLADSTETVSRGMRKAKMREARF